MRGLSWAWIASLVTSGTASRVAKRIGDAERADQPAAVIAISGFSEDVTMTVRDGLPATPLANVSIGAGGLLGRGRRHVDRLQARRARHVADADDLRAARIRRAGRGQRLERIARRIGHVGAVAQQDRRAQRRTREDGSCERISPVPTVRQHDRAGPLARVRGPGDRRRGHRRIGGIDPRGVLRGRSGHTEVGRAGARCRSRNVRSLESSLPPKHPASARTRISRGARRLTGGESRRRTTHPSPVQSSGRRAGR